MGLPVASITVDLDSAYQYRHIHGLPQIGRGDDTPLTLGVERLLDLFADHGIPATLFVVGADSQRPAHRALLERAHAEGHELGNHTFHHRYDLRTLPRAHRVHDIAKGEDLIAQVTGSLPVGFRTPGYNIDEALLADLSGRGYLYDSSVLPAPPYWLAKAAVMAWRAATGSPSGSSMTPARNLLSPVEVYRADPSALWREDPAGTHMWQVPMCVVPGVRVPIIGTSLHLFGADGFDRLMPALSFAYPNLLQIAFHAIDFVDSTDPGIDDLVARQPDLSVPWETKRALYDRVFLAIGKRYRFATLADAVRGLEPPRSNA